MLCRCIPRRLAMFAVLVAAGACGDSGSEPAGRPPEPAPAPAAAAATAASARAEAEQIFSTRCQTCHGAKGAGDGAGAAGLSPSPRNFQDAEFQQSVSDEHIANIIQYGGAAVGKSPTMPGNPDLTSRPEVVSELVALIRRLGRG